MKVPILCSALLAATMLIPAAAKADTAQHFLRQAIEGDNSEMALGRLAQNKAENPAVRQYGRTLASDHWTARVQAVNAARRLGVRSAQSDRDLAPEARDEQRRLSDMRGGDFDREFIRFMIDDHRKDIRAFEDESRENHGFVSQLAAQQLPTLRKHLDIAMSLQSRMGGDRNVSERYRDRGWYRNGNRDYNYRDRTQDQGYSNGYQNRDSDQYQNRDSNGYQNRDNSNGGYR
jgi:putative membrane protein